MIFHACNLAVCVYQLDAALCNVQTMIVIIENMHNKNNNIENLFRFMDEATNA